MWLVVGGSYSCWSFWLGFCWVWVVGCWWWLFLGWWFICGCCCSGLFGCCWYWWWCCCWLNMSCVWWNLLDRLVCVFVLCCVWFLVLCLFVLWVCGLLYWRLVFCLCVLSLGLVCCWLLWCCWRGWCGCLMVLLLCGVLMFSVGWFVFFWYCWVVWLLVVMVFSVGFSFVCSVLGCLCLLWVVVWGSFVVGKKGVGWLWCWYGMGEV